MIGISQQFMAVIAPTRAVSKANHTAPIFRNACRKAPRHGIGDGVSLVERNGRRIRRDCFRQDLVVAPRHWLGSPCVFSCNIHACGPHILKWIWGGSDCKLKP